MYKKGTIVLIPFPFTDLSGSKVRPAVIMSDGIVDTHLIVTFITTNPKFKSKYSVLIEPSKRNNLKQESFIIVSKITSLDPKIVLGEIGQVEKEIMRDVNNKLKTLLL